MPTEAPPAPIAETHADGKVSQGVPATGARPSNFRPPNPAFDGVANRMRAKLTGQPPPKSAATLDPGSTSPKPKPDTDPNAKGDQTDAEQVERDHHEEDAGPAKTGEPGADAKPEGEKGKKGGKLTAWQVADKYKKASKEWQTKAEAAEAELTKARSGAPPQAQTQELQQKLEAVEQRAKAAEKELAFLEYQRDPVFQEKYAKPYNQAWARAIGQLSEITVTDQSTGNVRAATGDDMLALVNLPLGKALEYAKEMFGEFASTAMGHREKIKETWMAHNEELEKAKNEGESWKKQQREQYESNHAALRKELSETWSLANQEILADPNEAPYLKAADTDPEGKKILEKGFALMDKAFANNPQDPRLTPEQRREAVKLHSAMRNRAAAYGHMKHLIKQRDTRIGELEKLLEEFGASEPSTTGGGGKTAKPSEPARFEQRFEGRLRKMAH